MSHVKQVNITTLWFSAGFGLVVALGCLLLGVEVSSTQWLSESYAYRGFPPLTALPTASLPVIIVLIVVTFAAALALEGTPGLGRRVLLLLSGLVVLTMASPVLALWGYLWNPLILFIAVAWSGLMVILHSENHHRVIVQDSSDDKVVPLDANRSNARRRKP